MIKALNKKTIINDQQCFEIDFCRYYPPDCELKEYCHCREIWNESDDDMDAALNNDELPF